MKTVRAIIQARMLSSRLRGKSLLAVAGKPLLMRVVECVARMPFVTDTVIATTTEVADEPIVAYANRLGVRPFSGDNEDVLTRFVAAAVDLRDDDIIARFTADNPLYDREKSTLAFAAHLDGNWDYTHIDGLSHVVSEFIRVGALRKASALATAKFDREHVTPAIRGDRHSYRVQTLPANFAELRPEHDRWLTIDDQNDLFRLDQLLRAVEPRGEHASLGDCYAWLDQTHQQFTDGQQRAQRIRIADREVGDGCPCFITAEIGQNHNGEMRLAKQLIEMAARCGCDAVKFQKRELAWELTRDAYDKPYDNPNSFGPTYGAHRKFLELSEAQHAELRDFAASQGLLYFCTACDPPSVEAMERIGVPCYKIASRDLENTPLLERVAATDKPVILSTGMGERPQIAAALDVFARPSAQLILTHCVSQYPTELCNVNLRGMETLRREFGIPVGLSDHTTGIVSSISAAALGACCVEKHITLSRAMPGTDHAAALEAEGLRRLVKYIREVELAMGSGEISMPAAVQSARNKLGRSLVSRVDIPAGTRLQESMLMLKSPGTGLRWSQRDQLLGRISRLDIASDVVLDDSQFEP